MRVPKEQRIPMAFMSWNCVRQFAKMVEPRGQTEMRKPRRSKRSPPARRRPIAGDIDPADFRLTDDQWTGIAKVTEAAGIRGDEARPRIEYGIGLYRFLNAHEPELRRRLSFECEEARQIRNGLRGLAERIDAFTERDPTIITRWRVLKRGKDVEVRYPPNWPGGPAWVQPIRRLLAETFDEERQVVIKPATDLMRALAGRFDWQSKMSEKERSELSRRSNTQRRGRYRILDSLVSELDQILYGFTAQDIERSGKRDDISFPYVSAVCRVADQSLLDKTIWNAMKRVIKA